MISEQTTIEVTTIEGDTRNTMLHRFCFTDGLVIALAGSLVPGTAYAVDNFPSRTIRLVVPFAVGGPGDAIARAAAEALKDSLKQKVLVEHVPGGSGTIGARMVAGAKPDGHTLLSTSASTQAIAPALAKTLPYDPVKDFAPVSMLSNSAFAASIGAAEPPTVPIVSILELSGVGASAGISMQKGIELAVGELNAKGGILGRKIESTSFDSQSNAGIARALALRAVDMNAYAVIGPIFSGSVLSSMSVTRAAHVPNFTGAAAANVTQSGNPYVFRISLSQQASIPRMAAYMRDVLKAGTIAIVWANNEFGRGGREVLQKEAQARGMRVIVDLPCEQGQASFAAEIARLRRARPDVVFSYLNEEESARFLRQLRQQDYRGYVAGESTAVSQKVIDLAGAAANGVIGHVALTAEAPLPAMQAFAARFEKRFAAKPDHNAIAGYIAMHIIKTKTEQIGSFEKQTFASAMKGATLKTTDEAGLLVDLAYDAKGDPTHTSWIVEVRHGRQVVVSRAPDIGARP